MEKRIKSRSLIFISISILGLQIIRVSCLSPNYLIVVSLDGFRYDYLNKTNTPNLDKLKAEGISVPYMRAAFSTKTFPNHHTIATGLYTEVHGIVDNRVWDPLLELNLSVDDQMFYDFNNDSVPIWIANEEAGGRSACVMWPGSIHTLGEKRHKLEYVMPFSNAPQFTYRIDRGIEWLTQPEKPANFLMLYFEEPDHMGHVHGPESPEVVAMIEDQDKLIGYLIDQLTDVGIYNNTNLIIVSDHGMQRVDSLGRIDITGVIQDLHYTRAGGSPVWHIWPATQGNETEIYDRLLYNASLTNYFSVYKSNDLPSVWHVKENRRVAPIVIVAEPGFYFDDYTIDEGDSQGVHGYDNRSPNMRPIFIARGPDLKVGYKGKPINNVDVFPLMSALLDIPQREVNGSLENVKEFLNDSGKLSIHVIPAFLIVFSTLVINNFHNVIVSTS